MHTAYSADLNTNDIRWPAKKEFHIWQNSCPE